MKGGGTSSSQRTDIDYFTKSGRAILDIATFGFILENNLQGFAFAVVFSY